MVTPLSGQDGGGDGADPQLMRWESASRSTHLRQAGASSLGEPPWMTPSHRGTLLLRRISNALWLRTPDARDPARRSGEQLPARQWDGDEALVGRAATILARRLGEEGERLVKVRLLGASCSAEVEAPFCFPLPAGSALGGIFLQRPAGMTRVN